MAKIDRDLDAVLEFCNNFKLLFLEPANTSADELVRLANDINSSMRGTPFATKSQEQVMEMAKNIKNAVDMGEERILVLEKKMRDYRDRGNEYTR